MAPRRRVIVALLALAGVACWGLDVASARAEGPRTAALAWTRAQGAETCADVQAVARAVDARLGREVFVSPAHAELFVDGNISREQDRWHVRVAMHDAQGNDLGTREFDEAVSADAGCEQLSPSITLVLSLMIDPEAEARVAAREAAGTPTPAPTPAAAPVAAPAPVSPPAPREEPSTQFSLGAGALLGAGFLPRASIGAALRFGVNFPGISYFTLEARLVPAMTLNGDSGTSASVSRSTAFLAICPITLGPAAVRVRACAGVEAGLTNSVGVGFDTNTRKLNFASSALLRGTVAIRLYENLVLDLGVTGGVALTRPRFTATDSFDVVYDLYTTAPATISGEAMLALDFF